MDTGVTGPSHLCNCGPCTGVYLTWNHAQRSLPYWSEGEQGTELKFQVGRFIYRCKSKGYTYICLLKQIRGLVVLDKLEAVVLSQQQGWFLRLPAALGFSQLILVFFLSLVFFLKIILEIKQTVYVEECNLTG